MQLSNGKWPRQYAAEIMAMKTRDERRAALDKVPEHFRALVKKHVECQFTKRNNL